METLFTVETPQLRLTWSGPRARRGRQPLVVRSLGAHAAVVRGRPEVACEEETSYPILVQSLDGAPVSLAHRDPVVTQGLVEAEAGRVVHGTVRFGSQAGRARFLLLHGGAPVVEVSLSVLPAKLGEGDVLAMREEVEAAAAGLAVSALRPTTLADRGGAAPISPPVWLAALRQSMGALAAAVREIDRRPLLDVARERRDAPRALIAVPTAATRQAVRQGGGLRETLPVETAVLTADTLAHRWLAARLADLDRRLQALGRDEAARRPSVRRAAVQQAIVDLAGRVRDLRYVPVLRGAGGRAPSVPPLVLRRRPAYAHVFDALLQMERGLALRDGALDVGTQDLAVLYETWAALAVVQSLAASLGVDAPARPFGADLRGTSVRLRRGRAHAVHLSSGELDVAVAYEPRFPAPPALLAQRPDLMITIRRGGSVERIVLDAKYRRDDTAAYRRRHGAAGPPEDALGSLHRYRDAIVEAPRVRTAAALFPGTADDAFYASRLWTSLDGLGVGAIPLRPGARDALDRFTRALVG